MKLRVVILSIASLLLTFPVMADEKDKAFEELKELEAKVRAEKAKAELEKAKAEAEKARAEAEKAKIEAELARRALLVKPSSPPIQPAQKAPAPGAKTHDGLFLRLAIGPGFGAYQGSGTLTTNEYIVLVDPSDEGSQVGGSISLGGGIGENLILHGDIWLSVIANKRRQDNLTQEFGTVVVGIGLTHYWMPLNLYLTGSIGLASSFLTLRDDSQMFEEEDFSRDLTSGVGAMIMLGKEWWVSDNWGLGVALQAEYTYAENEDSNLIFRHAGTKVLFSATFQ
jgi:hypothetical protein